MNILLTRDAFREGVFARDKYKCVFCDNAAVDAHHILERRLFPDGGYYINNGASVCAQHHLECEMTTISVEQVRQACNITKPVLPPHLYEDQVYDKWGNIVLDDGRRLRGELFNDQSVQKILGQGGVLEQFVKYVKYPRTYHLPWSPGMHDDDRMMPDVTIFDGKRVVVHEKLDGENTTMYNDFCHARSVTSGGHWSRNWIRAFHSQVCADIPESWRFNVENMYAKHSVEYTDLDTYAYLFAIWDERNVKLTWDSTLEWCDLTGIHPCPVIYWGTYERKAIEAAYAEYSGKLNREIEGYVVSIDEPYHVGQFRSMLGKYVRKGHVQTTKHWMYGSKDFKENGLKPGLTGFERWSPK